MAGPLPLERLVVKARNVAKSARAAVPNDFEPQSPFFANLLRSLVEGLLRCFSFEDGPRHTVFNISRNRYTSSEPNRSGERRTLPRLPESVHVEMHRVRGPLQTPPKAYAEPPSRRRVSAPARRRGPTTPRRRSSSPRGDAHRHHYPWKCTRRVARACRSRQRSRDGRKGLTTGVAFRRFHTVQRSLRTRPLPTHARSTE